MKNNLLHHFAIQDLKNHRNDSQVMLITLTSLSFVFLLITFLSPLFMNSHILNIQEKYGVYDYYSENNFDKNKILQTTVDYQNQQTTVENAHFQYALLHNIGESYVNASIDYVEGNKDVLSLYLKLGKFPKKENEIAIKESTLKRLGYEIQLQQKIEIPYTLSYQSQDDNQTYIQNTVGEWRVVGILKETGNPSILVGEYDQTDHFSIFIDAYQQNVVNDNGQLNLQRNIDYEDIGTTSNLNFFITMVEFVLFVIGCMIVSGLTIASFENKKNDYALLRGMGATQRQIYYIVLVQSFVLSLIAIMISTIFFLIIANILHVVVDTIIPLKIEIDSYIECVFIVFLMCLISYFMPARSATRRALSGAFESTEFQCFYYRYKKLHQMRPFYLGWRQLMNNKKQMIVKVFLILMTSYMMMTLIGDSFYMTYFNQKRNEIVETNQDIILNYSPLYHDENIERDDFQVYKPYAQDILYLHTFLYEDDKGYGVQVYCLDEDVKKAFSLDNDEELKSGEMIVNTTYEKRNNIFFHPLGVNMSFQIKDVIKNDESEWVIISKNDFLRYQDLSHYQEVRISFDSLQQKTKGMIAFTKQHEKMKYNIQDDFLQLQTEYESQILEQSIDFPIVKVMIIFAMFATAFIYIYQLSFELWKQRETIGTYQLIGFRKIEIWKIYMYKSLLIAFIGFVLAIYCHFAGLFMKYHETAEYFIFFDFLALLKQILPTFIFIIILVALSLLPIYSILKKDGLENKTIRE